MHSPLPSGDPTPLRKAVMQALVDYQSDGNSEPDHSSSKPADEAPEQPKLLPDVDAIIQETKAEMEQARLKADQLICQFAEAYVDNAGRLRDASIQRYRERLEGLPAGACAKVCETLAKDDIFCCNMDFGNGHLSYGGMSFTYKIESDAAFNALSHHAWKDLHQFFMKNQFSPLSGNGPEQGRPYVAHLAHSDNEEDGLEPHRDRSSSSTEESDSSSDEEDFPSSGDSDADFGERHGERRQSSVSASPEWTTDDETGSSTGTLRRRGIGRPPNHQDDLDVPEKRGPGRPKSKPWSAEDEILMREKMAMQLQRQGDLILRNEICMGLLQDFPGRTRAAIKNKWLDLKMKDAQDDLGARGGKVGALDAQARAGIKEPEVKKHRDKDSGSLIESETDDGDELEDREVSRAPHNLNSWVKNQWTPEQDELLSSRMESEMQAAGVTSMKVPPALQKEMASLFGRKKTAISRRWYFLAGGSWNGRRKWKKETRKGRIGPLVDSGNGAENKPKSDDGEVGRGSHKPVMHRKSTWTPKRDRILMNRMKSEWQSPGVTEVPVPPAILKELAALLSVHERTISRRWRLISGNQSSSGKGETKTKFKSDLTSVLGKGKRKMLHLSDDPGGLEGSWHKSPPSKNLQAWSAQEVEALARLTKGSSSSGDIDFGEVAARLPSVTPRTAKACKVYWHRHLQSFQRDQDRNPPSRSEAPEQVADASSRPDVAERSRQGGKGASALSKGLTCHKQPNKAEGSSRAKHRQSKTLEKRNLWSRDEDELLWRLALSGIPWRDVAAQMPNRTASACQVRYSLTLVNKPEYQERLNGQPGRFIHKRDNPKQDPEPDQESPPAEGADTVVWEARGSKHGRESDDEGEKRPAARRKKHRGAPLQSSLRKFDRDEGPEAEDYDELVYEFE